MQKFPAYEPEAMEEEEDLSIPADPEIRNFSYTLVDGKLYFRENSRMHPVTLPLTTENRVRGWSACATVCGSLSSISQRIIQKTG